MTRARAAAKGCWLLAFGLATGCSRGAPPPAYNVLLISLDTVRQDVLGCYGHRARHAPAVSTTPALDRLAREGVRMVDARSASSWTLPSHLSLLTGQPALVHGVETEVGTLDASSATMGEILQRHGYRTAGVYSAPYLDPHWGFARGFDEYQAVYGPGVVAASTRAAESRARVEHAAAAGDWRRYDELKRAQVEIDGELNRSSERAVTSEDVAAAVTARIATFSREARPWFIFAHFFDAHCDYVPPAPYDRRFDPDYAGTATGENCIGGPGVASPDPDRAGGLIRKIANRDLEHVYALYEGEVAWVDAHVERVLRALDAAGVTQKTLVVVVSDHGEEFFEHGGLGHRHTLYEEVVRVPMLLRLPEALPAGAAIRGAVSLSDVLPTVLDVLGLPAEGGPGSTSFLPLIRGSVVPASRTSLSRLIVMYSGDVELDGAQHVLLRQVVVEDAFMQGPIKITRTRRWPQFPTSLTGEARTLLAREAAAQYEREELRWVDVERFPAEPDAEQSARFTEPAVRAALEAFRRDYGSLTGARRHQASTVPQNVRLRLESLGYVDAASAPEFPEPDVVLPAPGAG